MNQDTRGCHDVFVRDLPQLFKSLSEEYVAHALHLFQQIEELSDEFFRVSVIKPVKIAVCILKSIVIRHICVKQRSCDKFVFPEHVSNRITGCNFLNIRYIDHTFLLKW